MPSRKAFLPQNLPGFLLGFLIPGAVFALLFVILQSANLFVQWEKITTVRENTVAIVGGDTWQVYTRTADNKVFSCMTGAPESCWIPDVLIHPAQVEPCDEQQVAFWPWNSPPRQRTACGQVDGSYAEMSYRVIYAVDQDGALWGWKATHSSLDLFLYPFALVLGGYGGVLIGTIVWVIQSFAVKKPEKQQELRPIKPQLVLLVIPWICLIAFGLSRVTPPPASTSQPDPSWNIVYTAAAETVSVGMVKEDQKWLEQITPSPLSPIYDFSQNPCKAEWMRGIEPMLCQEHSDSEVPSVRVVENPSIEGVLKPGKAVWVHLDPSVPFGNALSGEYPVIEIQPGSHFKTQIGCLEKSLACDVIFQVAYEVQKQGRTSLGRWRQVRDGQLEEIDLDLSLLSGKKVRFFLTTTAYGNSQQPQYPIWFYPRIEKE